MFLEQKSEVSWQPLALIDHLRARAQIINQVRLFFADKGVWEVETPLLSLRTVTDPYVNGIRVTRDQTYYLQTSPEYAMKRLLASGSGSIYQICKAFREEAKSPLHHPEFTMLEWYRVGFDHHALMKEMDNLLQFVINADKADKLSYSDVFKRYVGIDPHQITFDELKNKVKQTISVATDITNPSTCLELLFNHLVQPNLNKNAPVFIYDFPISQAALAKVRLENPPVASRFEVYLNGIELANGFHELQNPKEQRKRFEMDNQLRQKNGLPVREMDTYFLQALEHLPDCAGVALGIDRLVMCALKLKSIDQVMSFDF